MRFLIWIVSLAAIGLALAIALAGPGTRLGFWDYGTGLTIIRQAALPVMIAAGASLAALIAAFLFARGLVPLTLIALAAAAAAAFVPYQMRQKVEANPFIHDITTDFADPPRIILGAEKPRGNPARYVGDEPAPRSERTIAEAQREAFPDIEPIETDLGVEAAATRAKAVLDDMGMEILSSGADDEGVWRIEATHTSRWFGFIDDFIVRIAPEGDGARVDLRSKSRVGLSDLGANAERIRTFKEKFEARG